MQANADKEGITMDQLFRQMEETEARIEGRDSDIMLMRAEKETLNNSTNSHVETGF